MFDVKMDCVGISGKPSIAHRGYTLEGAIEMLAYHAHVPVELGTLDVVTYDGKREWHLWIEEDGVPVQPTGKQYYPMFNEFLTEEEYEKRFDAIEEAHEDFIGGVHDRVLCKGMRLA